MSSNGLASPRPTITTRHWFVLDFDGVIMVNQRPELYRQTKVVLSGLHNKGPLFLCSYNKRARDILQQTQLLSLFKDTQCGLSGSKSKQIALLAIQHGLSLDDCRFFDDCPVNIADCRKAGIHSTKVDPDAGLTDNDVVLACTVSRFE